MSRAGAAGLAPLVEDLAEAVGAGDAVGAGAVHDQVAVALEHAHEALDLLEHRVLLGPGQQGDDAALVEGTWPARTGRPPGARAR